jgi:hypothetical protein
MSVQRTFATASRVLMQLRHDPRCSLCADYATQVYI